ncbi:uncharacterized protein STEHIDRAFT_163428 [Stereum hirsutum FP-91666 SS1]|uniref:Uncharacterized protein n=1 Tax=Stereum hirsutum (strain FP-91666) TaxID=721885 RepID=R7RX08_STEHR|nr:uncharacterized protein STEHIDRAFT_163428 [Stereum hirsutum FP-91666 SS1]EIM79874.1 hypothetical protein STEHIDRAFT_163428 [Stereum hirsutum FP-91666 SS1]
MGPNVHAIMDSRSKHAAGSNSRHDAGLQSAVKIRVESPMPSRRLGETSR